MVTTVIKPEVVDGYIPSVVETAVGAAHVHQRAAHQAAASVEADRVTLSSGTQDAGTASTGYDARGFVARGEPTVAVEYHGALDSVPEEPTSNAASLFAPASATPPALPSKAPVGQIGAPPLVKASDLLRTIIVALRRDRAGEVGAHTPPAGQAPASVVAAPSPAMPGDDAA